MATNGNPSSSIQEEQSTSLPSTSAQLSSVTPTLADPVASSTAGPADPTSAPTTTTTPIKDKNLIASATAMVSSNGGSSKESGAAVSTASKPTGPDQKALASSSSSPQSQTKSTSSGQENERVGVVRTSSNPKKGKSSPVSPTASSNTASTKATSSAPQPNVNSSQSNKNTSAPTSGSGSGTATQKKKKRKRSGFAALLLALGCLSASEFEDPPASSSSSSKPRAGAATVAGGGESKLEKPSTESKGKVASGNVIPDAGAKGATSTGHQVETTGTTLVGQNNADKDAGTTKPEEQVVVAPIEPVIIPIEETAGVTSSAVQPPGSGSELLTAPGMQRRDSEQQIGGASGSGNDAQKTETSGGYTDLSDSEAAEETGHDVQDYSMMDEYEDEEDKLIAQGGVGIPVDEHGNPAPLLPTVIQADQGRKCLVLDLDETLLHSSFKMLPSADYIVPVEIESQTHNVYVIKRPGVDHFLKEMGKIYEIVVFTASLSKYADPVLDMLDVHRVVRHRLFRESCYNHKGNYVKDLSQLGRPIEWSIIIDNSPASYIFHPNNAVPISTWFNDPHDTELTDLCPFLADLATVDDVRSVLDGNI